MDLTSLELQLVAYAEFENLGDEDKAALGELSAKDRNALYGGSGSSTAPAWKPTDAQAAFAVLLTNPVLRLVAAIHLVRNELVVRATFGRYVFGVEPNADELEDYDSCELLVSLDADHWVKVTGFDRGGRINGDEVELSNQHTDWQTFAAEGFDPNAVAIAISNEIPARAEV